MIELKHISKAYGNHVVFQDLHLQFDEGKTYVIIGPSGMGKTTLLRLLMGLEKPGSGTIEGMENKKLSAVFQEDRLLDNLSVSKNIRLPKGKLSSLEKEKEIQSIREDLKSIGLEGCADQKASELSGGMKRRVSILRALRADYDIIFFDEASRGLDEENREKTMHRIQQSIQGKTVFWVTHDMRDLEDLKSYTLVDLTNIKQGQQ